MAMKKADYIKKLVEDYGYEEEDLKFDGNGNPYTNAKLKMLIDAEIADAQELEASENRVVMKSVSKLKDHDLIKIMSGESGGVLYRSEMSNKVWRFNRFGQFSEMPYGELIAMNSRFPKFLAYGWIIVLDKEVQKELGLDNMYKNILTPDNIDSIFSKPIDELKVFVKNLPEGMKTTFINKAQDLREKKQLNDMRVLELIEEEFGFSIIDNSPVNDLAVKGNPSSDGIFYINNN